MRARISWRARQSCAERHWRAPRVFANTCVVGGAYWIDLLTGAELEPRPLDNRTAALHQLTKKLPQTGVDPGKLNERGCSKTPSTPTTHDPPTSAPCSKFEECPNSEFIKCRFTAE